MERRMLHDNAETIDPTMQDANHKSIKLKFFAACFSRMFGTIHLVLFLAQV